MVLSERGRVRVQGSFEAEEYTAEIRGSYVRKPRPRAEKSEDIKCGDARLDPGLGSDSGDRWWDATLVGLCMCSTDLD